MSFGKIFNGIKKAKQGGSYGARVPAGQNRLVLKKYGPKATEKDDSAAGGYLLESEYMVASCTATDCKVGDSRGWPWFVQAPSWGGVFAKQNAQLMLTAVMKSIDIAELPKNAEGHIIDPRTGKAIIEEDESLPTFGKPKTEHDIASIGELATPLNPLDPDEYGFFRGIQLNCSVEPSFNKKTKKFNVDKEGKPYYDAKWSPVPGQTLASILEMRNVLDGAEPAKSTETEKAPAPTANMGGYSVPVTTAPAAKPDLVPEIPAKAPVVAAPAATATAAANPALAAMLAKMKPGTP